MDNSAAVNNITIRLSQSIAQQWSATMADRCVLAVGLSGGLDSIVLLHLLAQLRSTLPITLSAIHVHHGLSQYADQWQQFCQQICHNWSVPLQSFKVNVHTNGDGIEAAARKERYRIYRECQADAVVLAHHLNDQIETFFLAALRGGGLRALAAMPAQRQLTEHSMLWRPLLSFGREDLQAYAEAWKLAYIDDDSNTNTAYLRNWLRLCGLPPWRERVLHLDHQIEAGIKRLQDELSLIEEVAAEDWGKIQDQNQRFQISQWQKLSETRRKQQLRLFAQNNNLGLSTTVALDEFARQLMNNKTGAEWSLPEGKVLSYADKLWIHPKDAVQQWSWLTWLPAKIKDLPSDGLMVWRKNSFGLAEIQPNWIIRTVQSQDKITLRGMHKNVKKLLQERKIPPFMRRIWPVICNAENQCIAVINIVAATDLGVANGWMPYISSLPAGV